MPPMSLGPRRSLATLLALASASCGAPPPVEVAPPAGSVTASSVATSAPVDAPPASRPSTRALRASLTAADLSLVTRRSPFATTVIRDTIGVDARSIAPDHDWPRRLGVDPSTRIELEAAELDAVAAEAALRWSSYDPSLPRDVVGSSLVEEPAAKKRGFVMARASIRSRDALLVALCEEKMRAVETRIPIEGGTLFLPSTGDAVVARRVGDVQQVARIVGPSPLAPSDAKRIVAALDAWAEPEAGFGPPRFELDPRSFSLAAFWLGTATGLARAGTDPYRAARALQESKIALAVDAPDGAPRYGRATLTLDAGATLEAQLSASAPDLEPAALRTQGAELLVGGASARVSVNGALLFAWPLLPKGAGNPYRAWQLESAVSKPSWRAALLGPELPFYLARDTVEKMDGVAPHTLAFMRRFERLGCATLEKSGGLVCYGLMEKGATEASSACALEKDDGPCAPAARVALDRPTPKAGLFVTRKKVGDRWVLAAARTKEDFVGLKLSVVEGQRDPLVADVPARGLAGLEPLRDRPFHVAAGIVGRTLRAKAFESAPLPPGKR